MVGRLLASSDAVGRTLYPLILGAECWAAPTGFLIGHVLPRLEALEQRGREVKSRAVLNEQAESAREELQASLPGAEPDAPDAGALAQLAECRDLGPSRQGLYRFLYRLNAEVPAYLAHPFGPGEDRGHAVLLRVPRCGATLPESFTRWSSCLRELCRPGVSWMLAAPLAGSWVDVIVGEPSPDHTFFLLSAAEAFTTQIPYAMEDAFVEHADRLIAESRRSHKPRPDADPAPSSQPPAANPASPASPPAPAAKVAPVAPAPVAVAPAPAAPASTAPAPATPAPVAPARRGLRGTRRRPAQARHPAFINQLNRRRPQRRRRGGVPAEAESQASRDRPGKARHPIRHRARSIRNEPDDPDAAAVGGTGQPAAGVGVRSAGGAG